MIIDEFKPVLKNKNFLYWVAYSLPVIFSGTIIEILGVRTLLFILATYGDTFLYRT